jgi:hypothetical protein
VNFSDSFDLDKDNGLFWALQVTIVAGNVFQGAVTLYIRERVLFRYQIRHFQSSIFTKS